MSVGVTKDYKLKVRNLHASHTLGWSWKEIVTTMIFFLSSHPHSASSVSSLTVSPFPADDGAGLGAPALGTAPALLEASF
jgi:hypothetical protein